MVRERHWRKELDIKTQKGLERPNLDHSISCMRFSLLLKMCLTVLVMFHLLLRTSSDLMIVVAVSH